MTNKAILVCTRSGKGLIKKTVTSKDNVRTQFLECSWNHGLLSEARMTYHEPLRTLGRVYQRYIIDKVYSKNIIVAEHFC